jgi:hypothetical protein
LEIQGHGFGSGENLMANGIPIVGVHTRRDHVARQEVRKKLRGQAQFFIAILSLKD